MIENLLPKRRTGCPKLCSVCSWLGTDISVLASHRLKYSVSNKKMAVTMTYSGKLLGGPESVSSVDEDVNPKACRTSVTEVVP